MSETAATAGAHCTEASATAPAAGVEFARAGEARPTTSPMRSVLAAAAAAASDDLAARVAGSRDWRTDYAPLMAELTSHSARDADMAWAIADAGTARARRELVWESATGAVPLDQVGEEDWSVPAPATGQVIGAAEPEPTLRVPYRGGVLEGDALVAQLGRWVAAGVVEPSFALAITRVVENPQWLSLPGRTIAMMGAGGELSPLEPFARWGADILAVDLPAERVWDRIVRMAEEGTGRVRFPVDADGTPGLDIVGAPAVAAAWLDGHAGAGDAAGSRLVFGMYAYADRGAHVRISMATDLIIERLLAAHPSTALAYLQTPTDAFVVPPEVVAAGHGAWDGRDAKRYLQAPLRLAGRGALFEPSYRSVHEDGTAVADILVPQQGPSYAMAKRLQRWRGISAERAGHAVSFNVAPASWTRSVTKNRVLAAAYKGARRFGVEIFAADTTRVLMAALLAHDLNHAAGARPHPEHLFADQAAHGGLWRSAYEPKTVLGFAALLGMARL
ncbi:hypothetical protein [Tomitella fengzijianii]|uniref:Uncharacterized protein n=1 Tax=Tomitella fengzijianii TaxID=2597660 RepID=A0A516X0J4_9ACTN|nr:hypothetical protein [Tomitella fengzijianii]QDQ96573.1 hypothetical protein FO059_03510 [Tomitella fengzijianii]